MAHISASPPSETSRLNALAVSDANATSLNAAETSLTPLPGHPPNAEDGVSMEEFSVVRYPSSVSRCYRCDLLSHTPILAAARCTCPLACNPDSLRHLACITPAAVVATADWYRRSITCFCVWVQS